MPREDRTSTDNKRLFARILEEPYPHRYRILTPLGVIQRLIPTKSLGVVEQALWSDILIPLSTKEERLLQAHGLEYHVNVRVNVVQRGAVVIRKQRSVVYTAITMIMTVATYQV